MAGRRSDVDAIPPRDLSGYRSLFVDADTRRRHGATRGEISGRAAGSLRARQDAGRELQAAGRSISSSYPFGFISSTNGG
jgi:hypothetical protein